MADQTGAAVDQAAAGAVAGVAAGADASFYDGWNLNDVGKGLIKSKEWSTPQAVIDSYMELSKFTGADKNAILKLPTGDDADFSEVYNKLGRPENPDGYEFPDTEVANHFKTKLHELGLSKKQASGLMQEFDTYFGGVNESMTAKAQEESKSKLAEATNLLKKEWGKDYDANIQVGNEAFSKFAETTGLEAADLDKMSQLIGVDKVAKLFYQFGDKDGGIKTLSNYKSGLEDGTTAAYKLAQLQGDREFAMKLRNGDPKAHEEIKRLSAIITASRR